MVAIAYGTQSPAIGVAEFAPAARSALEAPPTTSSSPASATNGPGRASKPTATTAIPTTAAGGDVGSAPPTTTVGRARPCFGAPPRQLPDPRSPACIPTVFEGENGGATSRGVTATEIRVAWPIAASYSGASLQTEQAGVAAAFEYFNRQFELYGRRLVPVMVAHPDITTVPAQRAFAADIAAQGAFAVFEPPVYTWFPTFFQEIARQQVVTIAMGAWSYLSDREVYDQLHPYVWGVYPSVEQNWRNLADFACKALAGRLATHAGPSLRDKTRKFGVVAAGTTRAPATRPLIDGLAACNESIEVTEWITDRDGATGARTALERLRSQGVTTLVCACADVKNATLGPEANSMGWTDVEWLMPSFSHPVYDEYYPQTYLTAEQRTHLFGVQPTARVEAIQAQWGPRAIIEVRPDLPMPPGQYGMGAYEQLLILAAGIQAAGPNLTPDTFAQALMSLPFANATAPGESQGLPSVGFSAGDHTFIDDYAVVWWKATATPMGRLARAGGGSWCYLDRGTRYRVGSFPPDADSRLFRPDEPCR